VEEQSAEEQKRMATKQFKVSIWQHTWPKVAATFTLLEALPHVEHCNACPLRL